MLLSVNKLSKDFGFGKVINNVSFSINWGDRVAIVGKNGSGKSTLLKAIAGKESCDGGIVFGKGVKVSMLEQTAPDQIVNKLVIEILREPFAELIKREKELENMANRMMTASEKEIEKLVEKYSKYQEQFMADGGYEIENNINYVVGGLKINASLLDRHYDTLSGGEKTLVHFARILLDSPDILLLDEPTNHLDIDRIEWLENYLKRFKGGVLVVSHDRYFLDNVATSIIDIEDDGEIYKGNYSNFVREKENKELREFEQFKNEQKKIEELKKAVKRLYSWGEQADNPSMFRRAKAIQRRIDEMEANAINKTKSRKCIPIKFGGADRSGDQVIRVEKFSLILGDKLLFDNANLDIRVFDKIALVGANGMGKSSLIKCIMGEVVDYDGTIRVGESVKIGYLSQLLIFDNSKESILQFVNRETGLNNEQCRRILAQFEFNKDDIEKPIGILSGGEKIRIKIACLLTNKVNTLIFDEPTNHIDIFTREILEDAMRTFKGTIVFVSHDRYFINKIANKIVEIDNCKLNMYDGDYESYKNIGKQDEVEVVKVYKPKPPKISKGGKW